MQDVTTDSLPFPSAAPSAGSTNSAGAFTGLPLPLIAGVRFIDGEKDKAA